MKEANTSAELVTQFMLQGEESYIFACHASIPLLLTPDLLYQLWNNFKQYNYGFNPYEYYRIPHTAVSDLLLSPLCKKVGFELFEMKKECRDILKEHLVMNLGISRKQRVAAFLEGYAQIERHHTDRRSLKNVHLLTAKSILDPATMELQVFHLIREAKTVAEKLKYLILRNNLMPIGLEGNLQITSESGTDEYPMLIATNSESANVLDIDVPPEFENLFKDVIRPALAREKRSLALQVIQNCLITKSPVLDLRNCGLTDADLEAGTLLDTALRQCSHITHLYLSNWNPDVYGDIGSDVPRGLKNSFTTVPAGVAALNNLRTLLCNGEPDSPWGIVKPTISLPLLEHLDLSYNRIANLSELKPIPNLNYLNLSNNFINTVDWIHLFPALKALKLENNNIKDIRPLRRLIDDEKLKLRLENNPFIIQAEPVMPESEWPWASVRISASQRRHEHHTTLKFLVQVSGEPAENDIADQIIIRKDSIEKLYAGVYDYATRKNIFRTLFPEKIFKALHRKHISFLLDAYTAKIPWEKILFYNAQESKSKAGDMIRNWGSLKTIAQRSTASSSAALIISASKFTADDPSKIEDILSEGRLNVFKIVTNNANEIRAELNRKQYRLVQLNTLSNSLVIDALDNLKNVPEVVLINSSHAAQSDIAYRLLESGARAVVLLDGEFDLSLALGFDEYLYRRMLAGDTLAKAISFARQAVYANHGNLDYAMAYQCYGDPFYTFVQGNSEGTKIKRILLAGTQYAPDNGKSVTTLAFRAVENLRKERQFWDVAIHRIGGESQSNLDNSNIFILFGMKQLMEKDDGHITEELNYLCEKGTSHILIFSNEQENAITPLEPYFEMLGRRTKRLIIIEHYNNEAELLRLMAGSIVRVSSEMMEGNLFLSTDILELAETYEKNRQFVPQGDKRTIRFTQIVDNMKSIVGDILPVLPVLTQSHSAGLKLAAIAGLQLAPSEKYLDWLSGCIGDDEKPFLGYHASLALLKATNKLHKTHRSELNNAIQKAIANFQISKYKDVHQWTVIQDAENIIQGHRLRDESKQLIFDIMKGIWAGHYLQHVEKIRFTLIIWLSANGHFKGMTNEEGTLGKADIEGEVSSRGEIKFIKRYRRFDVNRYTISYTGVLRGETTITGTWSTGIEEGHFEMTKTNSYQTNMS